MVLYAQNICFSDSENPLSLQSEFKTNLLMDGLYPPNKVSFLANQLTDMQLNASILNINSTNVIKYYGIDNFQVEFCKRRDDFIGLGGVIANKVDLKWEINQKSTVGVGLIAAKQYTEANQYPYSVFGTSTSFTFKLNNTFLINAFAQQIQYSKSDPIAKMNLLFLQTETGINLMYQKDNLSIGAGQKTIYDNGFGGASQSTIQTRAKLRFK